MFTYIGVFVIYFTTHTESIYREQYNSFDNLIGPIVCFPFKQGQGLRISPLFEFQFHARARDPRNIIQQKREREEKRATCSINFQPVLSYTGDDIEIPSEEIASTHRYPRNLMKRDRLRSDFHPILSWILSSPLLKR